MAVGRRPQFLTVRYWWGLLHKGPEGQLVSTRAVIQGRTRGSHMPFHELASETIYHHGCVLSRCSHVRLFVTPWTVAHQAPLSVGFSRQGYWTGLPCPPPGSSRSGDWTRICLHLLHCRPILYPVSHLGSPMNHHLCLILLGTQTRHDAIREGNAHVHQKTGTTGGFPGDWLLQRLVTGLSSGEMELHSGTHGSPAAWAEALVGHSDRRHIQSFVFCPFYRKTGNMLMIIICQGMADCHLIHCRWKYDQSLNFSYILNKVSSF